MRARNFLKADDDQICNATTNLTTTAGAATPPATPAVAAERVIAPAALAVVAPALAQPTQERYPNRRAWGR